MSRTVEYHCLSCHDHSVTREFDVSHISLTCDSCGEFGRFINGRVLGKFEAFEASPPAELDWERLDRMEKFVVAEGLTRRGRSLDDFDVETPDDEATDDTASDESPTGTGSTDDQTAESASENGAAER